MDIKIQTYLLTLWYHENYGTALQAYALQKAFEFIGITASHIVCSSFARDCAPLPYSSIRKLCRVTAGKHLILDFYDKVISHTDLIYTKNSLPTFSKNPIKIVLGSDQVWNPELYVQDSIFTLRHFPINTIKFTYAPSVGAYKLPHEIFNRIKAALSDMALISCRDSWLSRKMKGVVQREIPIVLDPTLLFDRAFWENEARYISSVGKNYVLLYRLGSRHDVLTYAKKVAAERRRTLIDMTEIMHLIGPREFVGIIRNADFVITDSFHGLAFARIFNRPVKAFYKHSGGAFASDNMRLKDLHELTGCPRRLYNSRRRSWSYLRKVVGYDN